MARGSIFSIFGLLAENGAGFFTYLLVTLVMVFIGFLIHRCKKACEDVGEPEREPEFYPIAIPAKWKDDEENVNANNNK